MDTKSAVRKTRGSPVAQRLVEQRDDLAALLVSTTGAKDDE